MCPHRSPACSLKSVRAGGEDPRGLGVGRKARGGLLKGQVGRPAVRTVWPAGRGGSRGSRGGGGLAFLAWICLITPAMMLPPAFSSAYTCSTLQATPQEIACNNREAASNFSCTSTACSVPGETLSLGSSVIQLPQHTHHV